MNNQNTVDSKLSLSKLFPLGLQHVLAMYAGAVAVPLIVGGAIGLNAHQLAFLIAADLFTCGIATLLQSFGAGKHFGIKLPVILGCSFVSVGPMIAIGKQDGLTAIYGAIIFAGLFIVLIAPFIGKIIRFFPPIVTGSLVTVVGLSLTSVALNNAAGGFGDPAFGGMKHLGLAAFTLVIVLFFNRFFKGFMQAIAVLLGLIAGTIVGAFMGMVHFGEVASSGWFHIVTPFYFGLPTFKADAIIQMSIVSLMCVIEALGVFIALGNIVEKPASTKELVNGIRAEGLAQCLGGIFNSFPYTTFSQNVGLIVLSGVKSRYVTVCSGVILMVLGLIPKFAALATIIPPAVLGGATLSMFGMVAVSGMKMLFGSDLSKSSNLLIVATSITLGIGSSVAPDVFAKLPHWLKMIFDEGVIAATLSAIVLNIIFNWKDVVSGRSAEIAIPDEHAV